MFFKFGRQILNMVFEQFLSQQAALGLFQSYVLPLLIFFVVIWGVLSAINVFGRRINMVLAVAVTLLAIMTPQFAMFSQYMSALSGYTAIGAFTAVFVFGVIAWSFRRGGEMYEEHVAPSVRLKRLIKRKEEYMGKARKARERHRDHEYREWMKKAREMDDEIGMLSTR